MQINEIDQGAPIGRALSALGKGFVQASTGYKFDLDSPGQKLSFEASFLSRLGSIAYREYLDNRVEAGMLTPGVFQFKKGFTDEQIAKDAKPFAIRYFTGAYYYSQLGEEQKVELIKFINNLPPTSWQSMRAVRTSFYAIAQVYARLFHESKQTPLLNIQYLQQIASHIKDNFDDQEKKEVIRLLQSIVSASRSFQAFRRSRSY